MALRVIAVAGGAVIGALVSSILFSLIARIAFKQRPPKPMKRFIQVLGAVALALVAWKMPLGFGGAGDGLGGGFGLGGSGTGNGAASENVAVQTAPGNAQNVPNAPGEGDTLRIEMLGGERVQNERFYVVEGEAEPRTLAELRKLIQTRMQQRPPLQGIEIIVQEHSVAQNHPAVGDLERWAKGKNLRVTLLNK
jgi:hypothetical protein